MPYIEFSSSLATRRRMQTMAAGRDTGPEVALRRELRRRGRSGYRIDRDLDLPGVRRRADVAWVGRRVAVFVDGCFWHACPEHGTTPATNAGYWAPKLARNVARDRQTDQIAAERGWTVIRIWEHETPSSAANEIEAVLTRR
jgi:DNA mismatch endonuclease, patch repair protein